MILPHTGVAPKAVIVVAAHKPFDAPAGDHFLSVHVGAHGKGSIGYQRDDEGENISDKNGMYCELTGLYWAWRNLDADYIGLAHYRRQFAAKPLPFRTLRHRQRNLITKVQLDMLLEPGVVLVPQRRRYFISTVGKHYSDTLKDGANQLATTAEVLRESYPDYISAFDKCLRRRSAHMFNMFIMPRDLLEAYCGWLFDVLDRVASRTNTDAYSGFDMRFIGRIAETLLDVWLERNRVHLKTVGRIDLWKVNWPNKIKGALLSKFTSNTQEASS